MAIFYLVRHGKYDCDSVLGRNFIGHGLELAPLTDEGVNQAIECIPNCAINEFELL